MGAEAFMPTLIEFALFVISCIIIFVIINIIHYSNIERKVKKYSRCNNITSDKSQTIYKVKGVAIINNNQRDKKEKKDIYEIVYDFNSKTYVINQLAALGIAKNTVEIPVYNLKTYTGESIEKIFESEYSFSTEDIVFEGQPELVRFMQFGNTDFFEKKLF